MFKLTCLALFALYSVVGLSEEKHCFKKVDIKISKLHPRVFVKESFERRDSISILSQIDCKTGMAIIPRTYDEALYMLDFALPFDYKSAAVSESIATGYISSSVYRSSNYGSSVNADLFHYFHDAWLLDDKNNVCLEKASKDHNWNEEGCFWILVEQLIMNYQMGIFKKGLENKN